MNRIYSVVDYNPNWPKQFEEIKSRISPIFPDALSIEHVGSTSVEGMKAKPLIDVLIVMPDLSNAEIYEKQMSALGYECRKNYLDNNSLIFERGIRGTKTENVHVFPKGASMIDSFIDKRDFFRSHPEKAYEYGDLKEKLFRQFPDDYISYRAGKDPWLNNLSGEVLEWKNKQHE